MSQKLLNDEYIAINNTRLDQNALVVLSNGALSGLGTWLELNEVADTILYITFYKAFISLDRRNAILNLLARLVAVSNAASQQAFATVHKVLTSPFNFKKTENRFPKDVDKKEKRLPIAKLTSLERFYDDMLGKEMPLIAYALSLVLEENSWSSFSVVHRLFKNLLKYVL